MNPYRYWSSLERAEQEALAKRLGTSFMYLSHLFTSLKRGNKRKRICMAGPKILLHIEEATGGAVSAQDMRPDIP